MNVWVWGALTWAALLGLYLVFAGEVGTIEIVAGMVCASAGTGLAIGLSQVAKTPIVLRPPARAIVRPLASLVPEYLVVARELLSVAIHGSGRHRGDFDRQPYDFGADDPREAGRRALGLVGLSLAPRSFVVRGEPEAGTILLHGLPPKPASPDRRWPA